MNLIVRPSEITGRVAVPGSKSHTIRAVAAALAAGGESIVHAPLISADTISTLNAAERLGANAVIGVSIDYETVGNNGSMLMVTCSGTAVEI